MTWTDENWQAHAADNRNDDEWLKRRSKGELFSYRFEAYAPGTGSIEIAIDGDNEPDATAEALIEAADRLGVRMEAVKIERLGQVANF